MAGRKPKYDQVLKDLSIGKTIEWFDGERLTDDQLFVMRRRAKVLGIDIVVRTDPILKHKKVYRVA